MSFDESPLLQEELAEPAHARAIASFDAPAAPRGAAVRLAELPVGATAVLGGADELTPTVLRLLEMGFTPGAKIAITRRAPGGDPIEVRVRGTRLCVRRADLARFSATAEIRAGK